MNVPPKCDLLLIGFWDTPAVDNRGPEWQTPPHASVSSAHIHTHPDIRTHHGVGMIVFASLFFAFFCSH